MHHPVFSSAAFKGALRRSDGKRFKASFAGDREALVLAADRALTEFPVNRKISTIYVRDARCVDYDDHHDHLIYRSIARFIAKRFRISPLSRDRIVKGVIESLSDATPMYIIRRDIKKFYENIRTSDLADRLVYDTTIPSAARRHLKCFFEQHCPSGRGLPRGIGISATLSELYMEPFDRAVKRIPGVYRYFRFADDILIFCYNPSGEIELTIDELITSFGMEFNRAPDKHHSVHIDQKHKPKLPPLPGAIKYLGYKFEFDRYYGHANKKPRPLLLSIADRKIDRLKSRIIVSIKAYLKSGDYKLLYDRLRVLTGNYRIYRETTAIVASNNYINAGIFYNYRYCGMYEDGMIPKAGSSDALRRLDQFYYALVRGNKAPLSKALKSKAGVVQMERLGSLSFNNGFNQRISIRIKSERLREIKGVWRNV